MRIIAVIVQAKVIDKLLGHLRAKGHDPRARPWAAADIERHVQGAGGNVQAGWNVILGAYYDGDISLGREPPSYSRCLGGNCKSA